MRNRPMHTLLAATLALGAAPAFATAYSTATLGDFSFRLYDLDLTDNITPSITFSTYDFGFGTRISGQAESVDGAPEMAGFDISAPAPFSALAAAESTALSNAGAQVNGNGTLGGFQSISAYGGAHGADGYTGKYSATAYAPYLYGDFTISANTLVVFSATSTVSGQTSGSAQGSARDNENAAAWTTMSVSGDGPSGYIPGYGFSSQSDYTSLYNLATSTYDDQTGQTLGSSFTLSERAAVSFLNLQAVDSHGTLAMDAEAWGGSNIGLAAVPEPQTYAMMLAGLMLLGGMARRQRRGG